MHDEKLGRTRAQTRKLSTSSDEKPGMKRTGTMAATAKVNKCSSISFHLYDYVVGGGRVFEKAKS